ncbi:MAG: DNA-directed RNA polymerase subunit P [Candidatus Micrarchaeota archaeon]|nr:DNA-directed RNA polymerase subunit P [Candidatus Micrarchaeota archaeon]
MGYVCLHCGKKVKTIGPNFIRCPYCGYRVLAKERSALAREVSTD